MLDSLPISVADIVIVGVIVLAALLAFMWGFVRVVLVIVAWVGAALVSVFLFPDVRPFLREVIPLIWAADALTGVVIFVVALILFSIIADMIADAVRGTRIGFIDRALGFMLGGAIGVVLICAAYLGLNWLVETEEQPEWLRTARLLPMVNYGAGWLMKVVPPQARDAGSTKADEIGQTIQNAAQAGRAVERLNKATEQINVDVDKGYGTRERGALNQLLRSGNGQK
ncbi:MAG: CvpA family protein [Proteobacteria bacterium]|nr:CvpA family protein [Pseudomonadota bacterium]